MTGHTRSNIEALTRPTLALLVVLLAATSFAGCSPRRRTGGSSHLLSSVSPSSGYDPAWSADGSRIAYIEAKYRWAPARGDGSGLALENASRGPIPHSTIRVWDISQGQTGSTYQVRADGQRLFASCLQWLGEDEIGLLVSDLVPGSSSPDAEWESIATYRSLGKLPVGLRLGTGKWSPLPHSRRHYIQLEMISGGELAVWSADRAAATELIVTQIQVSGDTKNTVMRERRLPDLEWRSLLGAPGTMRTADPIVVTADGSTAGMRIQAVDRTGETRDIYRSQRVINGIFGSPDGSAIAFLEEPESAAKGYRCSLIVMPSGGGRGLEVADDAYGESRVAWAPDGTRIAYARSTDGHIVIAKVPKA